ncbi:hypothetical protein CERSUDRAFT_97754 [Gelatoporia subvermispora B]|uniref:TFIIB-type domain-containing protein n=1 Tax=Ceriporiopsis subvermispora (strain B) TaxID=914234 RepID=M2R751_CERS8|nr:hypothetical protein CERSUDRAFT_97754 [Gelatoporia subvermispora B]
MSGRCEECGESTTWDTELGSSICTHCGTLADPTQSVLTSHLEPTESTRESTFWNAIQGGTLKGRSGWALAGQSKDARDRRNQIAMHEFIRSLTIRLSQPGLSLRAQGVFDQSMRKGGYRWGRKAKLAAGAAVAIASRESRKSDSLRDIAYLLDEPPTALSRAFVAVIDLLQLDLAPADPAAHLPSLQSYLLTLVEGSTPVPAPLPSQLAASLKPLMSLLSSVMRTAESLSALISRAGTLSHLPSPPTAVALLMLALEGELLDSLPHAGALAQALGTRVGASKAVVMQRYKAAYEVVEQLTKEVPWLDGYERGKAGGRSKVAKRVVVARALKDVVQFQEDIWRRQLEAEALPRVVLEEDSEEDDLEPGEGADAGVRQSRRGTSDVPPNAGTEMVNSLPPHPKRKSRHDRQLADASQFLVSGAATAIADAPDLLSHLLSAEESALPHVFARAPSRLQMLAAARGGGSEEQIADAELFEEGELDALIRDAGEIDMLRVVLGWADGSDADHGTTGDRNQDRNMDDGRRKKRKRAQVDEGVGGDGDGDGDGAEMRAGRARGSKRINMEALERVLRPDSLGDVDEYGDEGEEEEEDEQALGGVRDDMSVPPLSAGEEEVVEDWRPLSPDGIGMMMSEDRYDL